MDAFLKGPLNNGAELIKQTDSTINTDGNLDSAFRIKERWNSLLPICIHQVFFEQLLYLRIQREKDTVPVLKASWSGAEGGVLYAHELIRAFRSCDPAEKDLGVSGTGDGRKEVQEKAFRKGSPMSSFHCQL